jgi:hypothetical protein
VSTLNIVLLILLALLPLARPLILALRTEIDYWRVQRRIRHSRMAKTARMRQFYSESGV